MVKFNSFETPSRSPIVSVSGIDGSGKSSAAREAGLQLSLEQADFSSLEVDRGLYLIQNGEAELLKNEAYDRRAGLIDGGGSFAKLGNRALYAAVKAQVAKNPAEFIGQTPDLTVNVRDPLLDSYVFAKEKSPILPPQLSLKTLKTALRAELPETFILLDTDPELALERIEIASAEREQFGEQDHENIETLQAMRNAYYLGMAALRSMSETRIVSIDGNRTFEEVSAEIQQVMAETKSAQTTGRVVSYPRPPVNPPEALGV